MRPVRRFEPASGSRRESGGDTGRFRLARFLCRTGITSQLIEVESRELARIEKAPGKKCRPALCGICGELWLRDFPWPACKKLSLMPPCASVAWRRAGGRLRASEIDWWLAAESEDSRSQSTTSSWMSLNSRGRRRIDVDQPLLISFSIELLAKGDGASFEPSREVRFIFIDRGCAPAESCSR